jgi:predicted HTH transcriptional regulator
MSPQLGITFHSLDGKDLCRVAIQPSQRPVFIKEGVDKHLYIRSGNSTRRLTSKETVDYCKTRWKAA